MFWLAYNIWRMHIAGDTILTATGDNTLLVFADDTLVLNSTFWPTSDSVRIPDTCVLALQSLDFEVESPEGILASTANERVITDATWRCVEEEEEGWTLPSFNDSHWPIANIRGVHGDLPWGVFPGISSDALWIWSNETSQTAYCRKNFCDGTNCTHRIETSYTRVYMSKLLLA